MIRIIIIEDEIPARDKLKRFIGQLKAEITIVAEMGSVDAAIAFLKTADVDLIISDIELQDGNAFEIYQQVSLHCPIIFTTAYDQFWMNAFETNGIDYLVKPFTEERFEKAWQKFILLRKNANEKDNLLHNLNKLIAANMAEKSYKKKFTVHTHAGLYFLFVENIVYFEATDGVIFAFDTTGKKHLLNFATLKELETQLNPADFFRINRSELIGKLHIEKIERDSKNTLAVKLKGYQQYHISSQSNTAALREWIEA